VLQVEDVECDAELIRRELKRGGFDVTYTRVETRDALADALDDGPWDIVVSDYSMPSFDARAALALVKERGLELPFIIVSGTIGEESAVAAMRAGAHDYFIKDKLGPKFIAAIERELGEATMRRERRQAQDALLKTEEQLRQSQKMEAIGRLAGGVAHDFNNILSVIMSYGELLLMDLPAGDRMREDVEEICKAGKRAADLTRQLLMFSRQQVLEPRVLDLNEVLASVDKMLQRILGADVALATVKGAGLGRVRCDPTSIEQVLMNLVVNARDAMPTGGKLTLETSNVELSDEYVRAHTGARPGPHVLLAVTDTGIGMDQRMLERIFEPFFTTKQMGKGTGLGLSTVFGIVQQNRGSVAVVSEVGRGTTFRVYLPRVTAPVDPVTLAPGLSSVRGTETILLVDDDEQVRHVARAILTRHGYVVLEARDAAHAIARAEATPAPIHLLLTDVVMPDMSGPDLAKRLAVTRPEMKVLCMSGYTDDTIIRHGVVESRVAYVQKPVTPESLSRRVREVLDVAI
jgi:signal transduction histidine kinase